MKKTFTISQNSTLEPIDSHEQKPRFPDIRNIIIAEEADKKYEQKISIPGIIGMNSRGCIVPCARFFAVACGDDISCTNVEILSAENKTGIISPCKGATV